MPAWQQLFILTCKVKRQEVEDLNGIREHPTKSFDHCKVLKMTVHTIFLASNMKVRKLPHQKQAEGRYGTVRLRYG